MEKYLEGRVQSQQRLFATHLDNHIEESKGLQRLLSCANDEIYKGLQQML